MSNIQTFKNAELGNVRVAGTQEQPLFCLKDVCDILEHTNSRKAKEVIENEFDEGVTQSYIGVVTGKRADGTDAIQQVATNFITEPQLYYLLMRSDLPKAKPFRQWVVNEVLPQIRKTGSYDSRTPKNMVEALELALEQAKQIQALNSKIEEDKPKVEFFDAVADSKDAISIGEVAKTLNMGIGRNRLFEILRNKGILQADNLPYQKYIDAGYFRVIEQKYTRPDGETCISLKTLVYQKGLNFIRKVVEQKQEKII